MDYDIKSIAIYTIIALVISLIIGTILAFLNIGEYSYIIAIIISGVIIGYLAKNMETAGFAGGIAGALTSILQGIIAPIALTPAQAALFPMGVWFLALVAVGAICGAGFSLIFWRK